MTKTNLAVLTDIIGAVESGGQVYGNRDYGAYAAPYTNSDVEHTITLGWAQNYGDEAKRLIQMIYNKMGKTAFKKIDKDGSIKGMLSHDWVAERWNPTSSQRRTLIQLITSYDGKACQDELFMELMTSFIAECEKRYTSDVKAQMMYCEIRHLGGAGPVKRIFDRCDGDYSLQSIMNSLSKDQLDTSNDNQVGDRKFWSRHEKCREFIEKYAVSEGESKGNSKTGVKASDVLAVARSWIGKNEYDGSHRAIIDLYNSYTPRARGYAVQYDDQWCDTTVSAIFVKLGAVDLIGGTECGVEEHVKLFKAAGIWIEDGSIVPKPGYIIVFNWDDASQPNDGYSDHIGIVEGVLSNTITAIEGNYKDSVARRQIPVGWGYIRGYAAPRYADEDEKVVEAKKEEPKKEEKKAASNGPGLSQVPKFVGKVRANRLNVRSWAGQNYPNIQSYPELVYGNLVDICDIVKAADGTTWYYIRIAGKIFGFVYSIYVERV